MLESVESIAINWPIESRFPGLDLLRLIALYNDLDYIKIIENSILTKNEIDMNIGLRILCNLCFRDNGKRNVCDGIHSLLKIVGDSQSAKIQGSLVSLMSKYFLVI